MIPKPGLSTNAPGMKELSSNAPSANGLFGAFPAVFSDIKPAHTVFALPFAVLGAFLSWGHSRLSQGGGEGGVSELAQADGVVADVSSGHGWWGFLGRLGLIVLCMFLARTWAMLVNRVADRRFDAANPRTAGRAVASGRLDAVDAAIVACGAGAGFVGACIGFWFAFGNPWPALLGMPALAWIALYSFTKRFTWMSHIFLGGAIAASAPAAAIAVEPAALAAEPAIWLIAGMVLAWVAGFDVLYALQDLDFDRRTGLRSVPAKFGWMRAVLISRGLHIAAVAALAAAWMTTPQFGALFGIGVVAAAMLLAVEHVIVARRGLAGLPVAFFTINGVVSVILGVLGSVDVIV